MRYREVDIVDDIVRLEKLIFVCSMAHIDFKDKQSVIDVLLAFAIPKLDEMKEKLIIKDDR